MTFTTNKISFSGKQNYLLENMGLAIPLNKSF